MMEKAYTPPVKTAIKVIDFGPLPNNATKSVPHGLMAQQFGKIVRLWGVAVGATQILPLPYAGAAAGASVVIFLSEEEINIVTGNNRSTFTAAIYIEYEV